MRNKMEAKFLCTCWLKTKKPCSLYEQGCFCIFLVVLLSYNGLIPVWAN